MAGPRRGALLVAAATTAFVLLGLALDVHYNFGGHWTALFCIGERSALPPELEAVSHRHPGVSGYDGQFYRLMAHDPFLARDYEKYLDSPPLRYRRILIPWLAWLAGLGNPGRIDGAYIAVVLVFLLGGCYAWAREFQDAGRSALWGGSFVLLPACLISLERMLIDLGVAALAIALLRAVRRRNAAATWALGAACALTRETGALLPLAVALHALFRREYRRAALAASSLLPAVSWWALVHLRLPPTARHPAVPDWFGVDVKWGILQRILQPVGYPHNPPFDRWAQVLDQVALLGCLGIILWAIAAAWQRRREFTGQALALQVLLVAAVNSPGFWDSIFGYSRILGPMHVLLGSLVAAQRRWRTLAVFFLLVLMTDLRYAFESIPHVKAILIGLAK